MLLNWLNVSWSFYSVNIKAESPDPTSSWRSLIPVIKVNISTVSTLQCQLKLHGIWSGLNSTCRNCLDDYEQKKKKHIEGFGLCSFIVSACVCVFLLSYRAVWHLGTTTSPKLCAWTLRMPSWHMQPNLHPATWTSTCTSLKARWRMCVSCWFPVHATLACRMTSK